MNTRRLLAILLMSAIYASCTSPCHVVWNEGLSESEGRTENTMEIQNPPAGTDWTMWFCQFRTPVTMLEGSHGRIEHISGTLYRVIPETDTKGETFILKYKARPLVNQCRAPEGFYLQAKGKKPAAVEVSYVFAPFDHIKSFDYNHVQTNPYDMIPRLKQTNAIDGSTDIENAVVLDTEWVEGQKPGWYRITVNGDIKVEAADEDGAFYASVTIDNLRRNSHGQAVPNMIIEDYPDLDHRGLMLDVSRNFTRKDDLLHLIDIMAHYKANVLHLHFGDDEGWRIEIDALPELTSYGAFRGLPVLEEDGSISEPEALQPSYCGTLDRNDCSSSGNGYYTHEDFVEILRYAHERRIRVIPEFDTPGHSRAAIKAMEVRAADTGDTSCRLYDPEDTSKYVSVQDYTDNAIDVSLETTYNFIEKVFDGIITMYKEAGVPLTAIHIGGDEVPEGAWEESPSCKRLMEEKGWTDVSQLKDYYIGRVLEIAERKGVKIAGWQEAAQNLSPETMKRLKEQTSFVNMWSVSHGKEELPYEFANNGINVVLSNSPNYYFDLAYNTGKDERGHSWSGFVDERRSFSFLPFDLYKSVRWDDNRNILDISKVSEGKTVLKDEARKHIVGVQGQLWTETIRSFEHVTYYLFPKAVGLFERGWNARPEWEQTLQADDPVFMSDFDKFFSIVTDMEYPYYESEGISYHKN